MPSNQSQAQKGAWATEPEKPTNLEEQLSVTERIKKIRQAITNLLDSISKEASLITRFAHWFGSKPWWVKILIAVVLIVPTLVTGLVTHMIIFYVFCGLTALIYAATTGLLVDHFRSLNKHLTPLKNGLYSIADILETVIEKLDSLAKLLFTETDKLKTENQKLNASVTNLSSEVLVFKTEVGALTTTEKTLSTTVNQLKTNAQALSKDLDACKTMLVNTKEILENTKAEYTASTKKFTEEVIELKGINESLGTQLQNAKTLAKDLKVFSDSLANSVLGSEEDKLKHKQTVEHLLAHDTHLSALSEELNQTHTQLEKSNEQYKLLLSENKELHANYKSLFAEYKIIFSKQEEQVDRLEKIVSSPEKSGIIPAKTEHINTFFKAANFTAFERIEPLPPAVATLNFGSVEIDT